MKTKLNNIVEFSNTIASLNAAGYKMPDCGTFPTTDEAMAFISKEADKAKELLSALPDFGSYRFYEGDYSMSIRCDTEVGSCHWEISQVDQDGNHLVPTMFYPDKHAQETYGLKPDGPYSVPVGRDIPYWGIRFARSIEGKFESFWIKDQELPFEESLAKKLIDDPKVHVGTDFCYVEKDGDFKSATVYTLPFHNPNSTIFRPTVHQPVSNASNVDTDFRLEILFVFDDGYLVPVTKDFSTGGSFSISAKDAMDDIIDALDGSFEDVEELLKSSGNYKNTEDGFILYGFSADGRYCDMEFDESNYREISRALASIRLIGLIENVKTAGSFIDEL